MLCPARVLRAYLLVSPYFWRLAHDRPRLPRAARFILRTDAVAAMDPREEEMDHWLKR